MDDEQFEYPFPLLIIAGKGGVGKTVLTAALGTASARRGRSTLLVEVGGQQQLPTLVREGDVAKPDADGVVRVGLNLDWVSLAPEQLLAGWLSGRSLGAIANRLQSSGALDVISSSVPGIKDALVLGQLRSWVDAGRWDRIIVDGPASGRAREMLRAPQLLMAAASDGPIAAQAAQAHQMLGDSTQAGLLLVTLPEETPVNETIETAFDAEDDPGITLAGVVVNRLFPSSPPPTAKHPAAAALKDRWSTVEESMTRLREELPIPLETLPDYAPGVSTRADIAMLIDPDPDSKTPTTTPSNGSIDAPPQDVDLSRVLDASVIVTVGTGGVGKTSVGAALAVHAAQQGRNVALITIDPAKRLADALGLEHLDDELRTINIEAAGTLTATMLDPQATFGRVVRTHASSTDQAAAILESPLSSQLAESLSGMTEYMAVERLWELTQDNTHDLVVVDTPPSADALAFLDAPDLLARLLDNRIYKLLVHGKSGVVERALRGLVNQLISIVGGAVVRDAVAFFKNFDGLETGFRARGQEMKGLLRSGQTSFVVVAAPSATSLKNAEDFINQLSAADVKPELMIVNRCTADPGPNSRSKPLNVLLDHLRLRRQMELESVAAHAASASLATLAVAELDAGVTSLGDVEALALALRGGS